MQSEDRTEDNAEAMEEDLAVPSFEFRFECAKLLIQLDESTDTAIEVTPLLKALAFFQSMNVPPRRS